MPAPDLWSDDNGMPNDGESMIGAADGSPSASADATLHSSPGVVGATGPSPARPPRPLYESRKSELNSLFGMKKWKGHLTHRPLAERSATVRALYASSPDPRGDFAAERRQLVTFGNVLYTLLLGGWMAAVYALVAALMTLTVVGRPYGHMAWALAQYHFWPFGKHMVRHLAPAHRSHPPSGAPEGHEHIPLLSETEARAAYQRDRCTGRRAPLAFCAWLLVLPLLWVAHAICLFLCFFLVVLMPMAKVGGIAVVAVQKI